MSSAEKRGDKQDTLAADLVEEQLSLAVEPRPKPRPRRRLRLILMLGGVLAVLFGAGAVWFTGGRYASTDDAYVRAAQVMVSTDVSGLVQSVEVHEGETVEAGQVLFRLDPKQFQIAVDNAKSQLNETALSIEAMQADYRQLLGEIDAQKAQVALDQAQYDRTAVLVKDDNASKAAFDQVRYTLQADQQRLASLRQAADAQLAKLGGKADSPVQQHPLYLQAKAVLDEAQRQLDHSVVHAPFAGVVTEVDNLQPGLLLVSQTAALTNMGAVALVSRDNVWIEAQLKETDMTFVKPGDTVEFTVDTYPDHVWKGRVESISPASGSEFSVLPAQNSSGNWVKVVQRIPVRIAVDRRPDDPILRAGMSVTVDIDTGHHRSLSDLL